MPSPGPGRGWEPVPPQALGPTSGRSAVLGRNALGARATAEGPASKISAQVLQAILSRIASTLLRHSSGVSGSLYSPPRAGRAWRRLWRCAGLIRRRAALISHRPASTSCWESSTAHRGGLTTSPTSLFSPRPSADGCVLTGRLGYSSCESADSSTGWTRCMTGPGPNDEVSSRSVSGPLIAFHA